jgi:hypothetical protein
MAVTVTAGSADTIPVKVSQSSPYRTNLTGSATTSKYRFCLHTVQYRSVLTTVYIRYSIAQSLQLCTHGAVSLSPYNCVHTVQYRSVLTTVYIRYSIAQSLQLCTYGAVSLSPYKISVECADSSINLTSKLLKQ